MDLLVLARLLEQRPGWNLVVAGARTMAVAGLRSRSTLANLPSCWDQIWDAILTNAWVVLSIIVQTPA